MDNKNITVVIGGVDKYSQAWKPFAHGFNKYWADCPWEKVFITNCLDAPKGFRNIKVGEDHSWGESIRKALEQIDTPYILWMMEDYWLTGKVKTQILVDFYKLMIADNINHIRMLPPCTALDAGAEIIPDLELKHVYPKDKRLWLFKDDAEYRASLATGFWKKDLFLSFIEDGMTPWEFEEKAGIKSQGKGLYLCAIEPDIISWGWRTNPYPNCKSSPIRKGQWTESAHEYIKQEKLDIDLTCYPNGARVSLNSRIRRKDWLYIAENSIIDDFCYISTKIEIGKNSHIASGCSIAGGKDMLFTMGNYSSLSSGVKIWCRSNDFVNDLIIITPNKDIGAKHCSGNVSIGHYCGVGANTVIMPNNVIPDGVAIGGMSWIPTNFKFTPWTVYAGIPIKPIKPRNRERILKQIQILEQ